MPSRAVVAQKKIDDAALAEEDESDEEEVDEPIVVDMNDPKLGGRQLLDSIADAQDKLAEAAGAEWLRGWRRPEDREPKKRSARLQNDQKYLELVRGIMKGEKVAEVRQVKRLRKTFAQVRGRLRILAEENSKKRKELELTQAAAKELEMRAAEVNRKAKQYIDRVLADAGFF